MSEQIEDRCTECGKPVRNAAIAWDGGPPDGEPIHEYCTDSAHRRMFDDLTQDHRNAIARIHSKIAALSAALVKEKP